jgi:hypothetical protein
MSDENVGTYKHADNFVCSRMNASRQQHDRAPSGIPKLKITNDKIVGIDKRGDIFVGQLAGLPAAC